jgi:hypothetical protein
MRNTVITIVLASLMLCISGCGGGGGGGAAAPQTVSGVAAAGSAIVGNVTLKDAAAVPRELTKATSDGSFSFDVTGLTKPYLLRVTGKANGTDYLLYSLAGDQGTANINPLSHLVVSVAAAGADLAQLYAAPGTSGIQGIAGNLGQALLEVQSVLKPLLVKYGVAAVDPIAGDFKVGVSALDLMLDKVTLQLASGILSISDQGTALAPIDIRTGFATYAVRGSVTLDGAGFAGVVVTATDAATGTLSYGSATTLADGSYLIANLPPGSYLVTPAVSSYSFAPAALSVTVAAADLLVPTSFQSFRPWAVSGKVSSKNLLGLAGVTISAQSGGASFGSAVTDASGAYSLNLPKGSYTVTAARKDGYNSAQVVFTPASGAITISDAANHAFADFASDLASYTVAGKVTRRLDGSAMAAVALTLVSEMYPSGTLLTSSDAKFSTVSDASGNYSFAGMPEGYYALTPKLTGFVFNPNGFRGTFDAILVNNATGAFDINGVSTSELTGGLQ